MKKNILKTFCLVLCGIILTSNTMAFAMTVDTAKNNNKVIKSHIKDSKGKEIIEYYGLNYLPDSYYSTSSSNATLSFNESVAGAFNVNLATITPLNYSSTLTGAYNGYTQAIATSDATRFIDNIYVSMQAWLVAGTYVGQDMHTNPSGTTTCNQTASLQVPSNPFNYQFGSALSQHTYTCTGYEYVSHSLTWSK